MVIDLSQADDEAFQGNDEWEPVPEGTYPVYVYEVSYDDNYQAFDFTFKIDGGEHDDRELETRVWLTDSSGEVSSGKLGWLKHGVLAKINEDFEAEGQVEEGDIIEATQGKPCRVEISHRESEHNGEIYTNYVLENVYEPDEEQLDTADHLPT